ncbi:MAG: DsbA family oxidoreductase [Roseomonas sp.]|nr:DsbA family oxidoreductase [Roseomonas sp.]MCA3327891.1 DsbA family oxidoreductase [Roseomonas sp.]MCA3331683.1 DsbA family oxidoreductase [Roseomonas sp.]MCA3333260.1 DsbA family oxidoreductase [Roseomonas sp.]MCA3348052.1 DsbA family oxidoreductase [Roseomonas sp.]
MLAPPQPRLDIDIAFDLICPWCYLGVRRLRRALRARPDIIPELLWRPFLLNPDIPPGGVSRAEFVARKFGGEDRARRLQNALTELGRAERIGFRFDLMGRVPSSINAHRLVRYAVREGLGEMMVEALFHAYFADGTDIGDLDRLAMLAGRIGLDVHAALGFLRSGEEAEAVHTENLRAHRLGINGVPCFIIAGQQAIAGAQEPEVLERLLDVALQQYHFTGGDGG